MTNSKSLKQLLCVIIIVSIFNILNFNSYANINSTNRAAENDKGSKADNKTGEKAKSKYLFRDVSDKKFNFVKLKEEGNIFCQDYEVVISDIPATVVNGKLSIEYEYYKKNILPKIYK